MPDNIIIGIYNISLLYIYTFKPTYLTRTYIYLKCPDDNIIILAIAVLLLLGISLFYLLGVLFLVLGITILLYKYYILHFQYESISITMAGGSHLGLR